MALGESAPFQVTRMIEAMDHRGVRSRAEYGAGWSVGHRRLPVVGTGQDHDQPVRRGPWTVAFVGEVLDFRERRWGAECDLELVADAWSGAWQAPNNPGSGPTAFRKFDGFWAVAAYDRRDRTAHLLVDYLSQKPLYVRDDEHALAAASEPDAVALLGPLDLDRIYLSSVVKWGYCPETWRTPYLGVRRMLPGEHAIMDARGCVGGRVIYRRADVLLPIRLSPEELRGEVEAAVRRRVLSADVPVACLVSGGLDSAIVYTLASRHGDVRAYHVENGEADACRAVVPGAVPLDCAAVTVREGLGYMQEPIDLGSLSPQVALARAVAASGGETVVLTGDGADELFGGYPRASRYDSQASDVWHELVGWHLPRLDRIHMRHLQEVRSPFLARRVAAAALALPWVDRTDKRVLRDLFRADLPPGVADRPKVPLRTPDVVADREGRSRGMVELFLERFREGGTPCRG